MAGASGEEGMMDHPDANLVFCVHFMQPGFQIHPGSVHLVTISKEELERGDLNDIVEKRFAQAGLHILKYVLEVKREESIWKE